MQGVRPLQALAALGLVVASASSCATQTLGRRDWYQLETPHFEVLSSLDPQETRRLGRDLELFHAAMAYVLRAELPNPPKRPRVYAFDGRGFERPFNVRGQPSYFLPDAERLVLVLRTGGGFEDASEETLHEYAHFMVRQHDRRRPIWYEEGIAQLTSNVEPRGARARVALPRADLIRMIRDWSRSDLDSTLEAKSLVGWSLRDRDRFIAESWALAHYATVGPNLRRGRHPLVAFREALDAGRSPGRAAEHAFGSRGQALADELRAYVAQPSLRYATVLPPRTGAETSNDPAVEQLGQETVRIRLGQLSLLLGRAEDAHDFLYGLPNELPEASAGLARTYRIAGYLDEAEARIQHAVGLDPDDGRIQLEAGLVQQALAAVRPGEKQQHLARARQYYARAFQLDAALPAAPAAHASTFLIEGEDASQGLPLARRAYRMLPGSLELQLLYARLEAARGNLTTARLHAVEVASRGHDQAVAREAGSLLESLGERR